ncbi:hypothetical protein HMPREF1870_01935 [Bacteroidales bacterium KA00344]|nr:hypothetical protein HMPREF1870_01935 [Bacteroidales bacterium KA00344]
MLLLFTMLLSMSYAQAVFDFDANGGNRANELFGIQGRSDGSSNAGDITSDVHATVDNITITVSPSTGKTPNRIWRGRYSVLRMYGGKMTISSADKNITKIVFLLSKSASHAKWSATADKGTLSKFVEGKTKEVTWTGDAKDVVLTVAKNTQFSKITVYTNNGGGETPTPTLKEAANIAAFNALAVGTEATLTLKDAQVLYSWTSINKNTQTFVRDATGTVMFYNTGLDLKAGQKLNGTVVLKRDDFNGTIEAVKAAGTNAEGYTVAEGTAEPKVIEVTEANQNLSNLVKLNKVNIVSETSGKYTNFYAVSGANRMQLFNGFHIDGYTPAAAEGVDVVGIVTLSKGNYRIQPITAPVTTGIGAMQLDENDNAPVYNVSGQRVGAAYKGLVIKNGKKYIQK